MKTAQENFLSVVKKKKCLFLEGDNGLYHGLERIEQLLITNKVEYSTMFDIREVYTFDQIKEAIGKYDVIIFQTRWVYALSDAIRKYMISLSQKKIVIECYIGEPTWYYKPDVIHDVYILKNYLEDEPWKFYKLSKTAYWNYKNKFNK